MKPLLLVFSLVPLLSGDSAAESAATPAPATKTETPLILKVVSTKQPAGEKERFTHEIFLQATRFESLDALKSHLATLPRGTRIEYDYSRSRSLLNLQSFCTEHGIQLEPTHGTHEGAHRWGHSADRRIAN